MFETSGNGNAWMIAAWAPRVPRPVTTSLLAAIYNVLPNDTDLSVFKRRHIPGLNFAFIGAPTHYHTPYDNFANSSPASLQHEGDGALAAVTALAEADLANPPPGNLVFFDVLSLGIARWPLGWTLGLAVLGLALIATAAVASLRHGTVEGGDLGLGLLLVPAALVLTALLAFGIYYALAAAGPLRALWIAHPTPALTAFWLLALAVVAALGTMLGRRSATLGLWVGVWIVWGVLGIVMAVVAPAMSYVFVAPALVAGLCALLARVWQGRPGATAAVAIVPGIAAALLWFGVVPALYDGLGVPALWIIATLVAVLLTPLAPLAGGGGWIGARLWLAALVAALVALVVALPQPRFSMDSPQPLTFIFFQDADSGQARWLVQGLLPPPPAVAKAAAFGRPAPAFPWSPPGARALSAPAPALAGTAGPELQVVESTITGGQRHLKLHLSSRRGARDAAVFVPAAAHPVSVAIEGHAVSQEGKASLSAPAQGDWIFYSDQTLPAGGCDLEMVLGETASLDWYVVDSSPGLPPSGAALLAARPPSAVPIQSGDTTKVARKVKI
jgi:Peptidase family M28